MLDRLVFSAVPNGLKLNDQIVVFTPSISTGTFTISFTINILIAGRAFTTALISVVLRCLFIAVTKLTNTGKKRYFKYLPKISIPDLSSSLIPNSV